VVSAKKTHKRCHTEHRERGLAKHHQRPECKSRAQSGSKPDRQHCDCREINQPASPKSHYLATNPDFFSGVSIPFSCGVAQFLQEKNPLVLRPESSPFYPVENLSRPWPTARPARGGLTTTAACPEIEGAHLVNGICSRKARASRDIRNSESRIVRAAECEASRKGTSTQIASPALAERVSARR